MSDQIHDIDKVKLYGDLALWSRILLTLDKKLELLCKDYRFGKINLSIVVHNGEVLDIIYSDEIRVREKT